MPKNSLTSWIFTFILAAAVGQQPASAQASDVEVWQLGWRMLGHVMEENWVAADAQFDSLQNLADTLAPNFFLGGLLAKTQCNRREEVAALLATQPVAVLQDVCTRPFLSKLTCCAPYSKERAENEQLQMELIRMYVDDQAARGHILADVIAQFDIDTSQITPNGPVGVDEKNRERLKAIIAEYGFPTKALVGRTAMEGVFLIIQHADQDKTWQKSQLQNLEESVSKGDMDSHNFAYLYDRILVSEGQKQRYGTQFAKVDPISKTVELAPTEAPETLDDRRRAIGMMPIAMYIALALRYL